METLQQCRLLPLIDVATPEPMPGLATALRAGGLPVAEVALRRQGSLRALRALAAEGGVLVGAGTVITATHAADAVAAGARFLVSPGYSPSVAAEASQQGVPFIPGVATATELMAALEAGITTVKFFPAGTSGGAAAIRALSAVAPDARWVPTGGIDAASAAEYLDIPAVLAVGGTWMTPRSVVEAGLFDEVTDLVRDARGLTR